MVVLNSKKIYKSSILKLNVLFLVFVLFSCKSLGGTNSGTTQFYDDYISIADTYFSQEKYDKAINYYKLALGSKENYWTVYYRLGKACVFNKSWNEAAEIFKNLLKRDPDNSTLKSSYAYILAMQGNLEEALKLYDELVSQFPEVQEYLENFIAVQFLYEKNLPEIGVSIYSLMDKFPESTNLKKFKEQYDRLIKEKNDTETAVNDSTEELSDNAISIQDIVIDTSDELKPLLTD